MVNEIASVSLSNSGHFASKTISTHVEVKGIYKDYTLF